VKAKETGMKKTNRMILDLQHGIKQRENNKRTQAAKRIFSLKSRKITTDHRRSPHFLPHLIIGIETEYLAHYSNSRKCKMILRPKPRNRYGDFEAQITKLELLVLMPKSGNPPPPWF
jgi:hypothetical protein